MTPAHAAGVDRAEVDALLTTFGENLKMQRKAAGISQASLAAMCFLRRDEVSALERGQRVPNLIVLSRLAHALDSSIAALTRGVQPPLRRTSTEQVLALIAGREGVSFEALISKLPSLTPGYVEMLLRRLDAKGIIVFGGGGWHAAPEAQRRNPVRHPEPAVVALSRIQLLSGREREVLAILRNAGDHDEVATRLHISRETARSHTASIRRKLGIKTTRQLRGLNSPNGPI